MRRKSKWKLCYVSPFILRKKINNFFFLKNRGSTVTSWLIGKRILVYNGTWQKSLVIQESMVGKKLGSFSFTRPLSRNIHVRRRSKYKKGLKKK